MVLCIYIFSKMFTFLLRQNWIAVIYYYNRIPKELYKMKNYEKLEIFALELHDTYLKHWSHYKVSILVKQWE